MSAIPRTLWRDEFPAGATYLHIFGAHTAREVGWAPVALGSRGLNVLPPTGRIEIVCLMGIGPAIPLARINPGPRFFHALQLGHDAGPGHANS
jgi:hypothetical protein